VEGVTTMGVPYAILRGPAFADGSTAIAAGPVRSHFACFECRREFATQAAFQKHKEASGHMKATSGVPTEIPPAVVAPRRAAAPAANAKHLRAVGRVRPTEPKEIEPPTVGTTKAPVQAPSPPVAAESAGPTADTAPSAGRAPSAPANLLLARRARGMSRARLAERTDLPGQALALFENGWVDLWPEDKTEIARVLQVPGAVLWGPSTDVLLAWLEREDFSERR
jgi:hypothetical protein